MTALIWKALGFLGISKGITALVLLGVIAVAGFGGYLWIHALHADQALLQNKLDAAELKAAANAAVVQQLQDDQKRAFAVMADLAGSLGRLDTVTNNARKEILRAPPSTACLDSPGMRSFLGELRFVPQGSPAAAPGRAPAAGRTPATLPTPR